MADILDEVTDVIVRELGWDWEDDGLGSGRDACRDLAAAVIDNLAPGLPAMLDKLNTLDVRHASHREQFELLVDQVSRLSRVREVIVAAEALEAAVSRRRWWSTPGRVSFAAGRLRRALDVYLAEAVES